MGWAEVIAVRDCRTPELSDKAKHVLMNLATRIGGSGADCWPSQKRISEDTSMPLRCVQRALYELKVKNVIAVESGKLTGRSNSYRLNLSTTVDNPQKVRQCDVPRVRQNPPTEVRQRIPRGTPNPAKGCATVTHEVESNLETETSKKEKSVSSYDFTRDYCRTTPCRQLITIAAIKLGLSEDEARRFCRYNQARDWRILAKMDFNDAVLRWRDTWQHRDPEGYAYHIEQLRERARLREEAALRALIASET